MGLALVSREILDPGVLLMPIFEIEQYEVHTSRHRVEAKADAEAVVKLLSGLAEPIDGSLEFVEIDYDRGLSANMKPDLAQALQNANHMRLCAVDEVIPSIRSITESSSIAVRTFRRAFFSSAPRALR